MTDIVNTHRNDAEKQPSQSLYLTFTLSREEYAISIVDVREIVAYTNTNTDRMMSPASRSEIHFRGYTIPLIDLSERLGLPHRIAGKRTCIVIVDTIAREIPKTVGLLVDSANELIAIPPDRISPPLRFCDSTNAGFVDGIGHVEERIITMLALDRLLSPQQHSAYEDTRIAFPPDLRC